MSIDRDQSHRPKGARRRAAKLAAIAALVPAAGGAALAAAPAVQAASPDCSTSYENACISVNGSSDGNPVTFSGNADASAFQGTLTLAGPDGSVLAATPDQVFDPAGAPYRWTLPSAAPGTYCVTGTANDGTDEGTVCTQVY